jgi:hypothetical protein
MNTKGGRGLVPGSSVIVLADEDIPGSRLNFNQELFITCCATTSKEEIRRHLQNKELGVWRCEAAQQLG